MEQAGRAALARLWERFREPFSEQVAVLEEALIAVLTGALEPDLQDRARREAHKLSGSLGTFGMPRGSEIARDLESWFRAGAPTEPADVLRFSDAVVALRGSLDAGPAMGMSADPVAVDGPFLLLVEGDPVLAHGLSREAPLRDLRLVVVNGVDAARRLLRAHRPHAAVVELTGPGSEQVFELMGDFRVMEPPVPVVVLTRADAFTDRVKAAQLGGRGFLHKPVTAADVLRAVAEAVDQAGADVATLLAVDDDPALLAALAALLEPQGHRVRTLDEPARFWDVLHEVSPDLVVLDVDMPQINGVELCQVMRADQRWSRVPVIFLTSRRDAASASAIFAAGADDYVAKPLIGAELTTRISNRLERSRLLRRMAETDLLTGVANQRTSEIAMERLLGRAARDGQAVAVAMIDVDRLRGVNDRFGYGAGDEILGRLGHLLRRAFGADDAVGRWAGQEFVVAMLGMTRGDGVQRLSEVLEALRIEHFSYRQDGVLGASFSGGVAQFPHDGDDLRSLYRSADGAVRRAKQIGGDRVVPVGWSTDDGSLNDVVIVEDDQALAGVLLHALATRGYRTQRFDDGLAAAVALQGPSPTLSARVVLLDWGLPSLDGLRVLRRLAETGVLARTRVIMLTARDSEAEVLQALDLGAFDHVAKPFSVPVLMKRVHRAMEW